MDRETILFEVADNVATITLNRPDSLNSFNNAMAADMQWAWETVRDTDDIHCVVLQANGDRAFCTGVDIRSEDLWFMKARSISRSMGIRWSDWTSIRDDYPPRSNSHRILRRLRRFRAMETICWFPDKWP